MVEIVYVVSSYGDGPLKAFSTNELAEKYRNELAQPDDDDNYMYLKHDTYTSRLTYE